MKQLFGGIDLCPQKLFPKMTQKSKTLPSNFGANKDKYLPLLNQNLSKKNSNLTSWCGLSNRK